jgi:hypothetical protein
MKKLTPLKAIRLNCIDCQGGSKLRVRLCDIITCPLYIYRFGHNDKRKNIGNKNGNPNFHRLSKKGKAINP